MLTSKLPVMVFDFGGVLLDWNPWYLYRQFFDSPQAMEAFFREIDFSGWNLEQDRGRPFAEAVTLHAQQFPHHAGLIRAYHEQWPASIGGAIPGTVDILTQLKARGYPLYALSNWSAETHYLIRPQYEFFEWFDGIVLSGEVKLIKPDPKIYQLLLEKAGAPAEDCLFIDDSLTNVRAAQALGFGTIHFQSPEQLRAELSGLNIL